MIRITKEDVKCSAIVGGQRKTIDCTDGLPDGAINAYLISHRMHAQVFDCGDK